MPLHLILGGARSGKSRHAEQLALATHLPVTYIATAHAGDGEMAARISHHRDRRPASWRTVEAPVALAAALREAAAPGAVVLVDCLTLWLSNLLFEAPPPVAAQTGAGNAMDAPAASGAAAAPRALVAGAPDIPLKAGPDPVFEPPARYARERAALLASLPALPGQIFCVSNEIGWGVVPMGALTRYFTDEMGRLNQDVAALAQRVTLTVAGLPLQLKS